MRISVVGLQVLKHELSEVDIVTIESRRRRQRGRVVRAPDLKSGGPGSDLSESRSVR